MKRREFMNKSILGSIALGMSSQFSLAQNVQMPRRTLGRTGESLSMLGFGGILVKDEPQKTANDMVAKAFDFGINYFDVAPSYGDAEDKLGPALQPYRQKSFLACKTGERTSEGASKELVNSLKKLRTDYFDLYQLHHLTSQEDIETAFGSGGAMEVFIKAKEEGKVKYLGFSAHSEEAALMAMERYDFDTVLFPINFVCWFEGNFGPRVVERAKETNKGILALKGLAYSSRQREEENKYPKCWYNPIPEDADELARLALTFTFSQGVTAAIPPGEPVFWDRAFSIACNISPLSREEVAHLKEKSKGVEPVFKTT